MLLQADRIDEAARTAAAGWGGRKDKGADARPISNSAGEADGHFLDERPVAVAIAGNADAVARSSAESLIEGGADLAEGQGLADIAGEEVADRGGVDRPNH